MTGSPRRVGALVTTTCALLLVLAVAEGLASGAKTADANDPRSGAALNLEAAKDPAAAPPALFPEMRRINALAVNDPSADSTAQDTQSETTIAVDGSNVVVGYNDSGSCLPCPGSPHFTGFANSTNNGVSFTDRGALPASAEGDGGDPVLAFHRASNSLYFSTLGFNTGENLQVFKSTNGGTSFGAPVNATPGYAATGDFQDKEWMDVDNFAGAQKGNVYVCWTNFNAADTDAEIRFTRSVNGGASFTPNLGTLISSGGQGCYVEVGPNHEIYVFYYRGTANGGFQNGGDNKIFMRKSTNGGVSFAAEVQVADLSTTSTNGGLALNGDLRSNSFPHAEVNPVSGDIVVTYNDDPAPAGGTDRGDVFYTRSVNGGNTWGAPVRINEDGAGDQFFPDVSISPNGTRIITSYYSRSHDASNLMFHRRGRIGTMNTATGAIALNRSFQLGADSPITIGQDPVVNPTYMGDYDDADSTNTVHHHVWSDNRDGNSFHERQPDVFYAQVPTTANNTDVGVTVTPSVATVDVGETTTLTVDATATGGVARDAYINLPRVTGLHYRSASGNCDAIGSVVSCSLGNIPAGGTRTRTVQAVGVIAGARTARAGVTTTSRDTTPASNSDTAAVTVNAVPQTTQTFSTGNLAVPVPDNSTVNVPLNVNVVPNSIVTDVNAQVRINHTFVSDLDVILVSPAGDLVDLSTNNGGSGDNYGSGTNDCSGTHTVFDDEAATPITSGVPPFAGSFMPEAPLSLFDGTATDGTWTLRVRDEFTLDTGTIGCFKLTIRHPT